MAPRLAKLSKLVDEGTISAEQAKRLSKPQFFLLKPQNLQVYSETGYTILLDCDGICIAHSKNFFPGDQIMMVATAAIHRHDAFQSAEFLMDYLKSRAPFWKKEITKKGYHWVESVFDDEKALERW